ncbi:hypothetical protein PHMEG_00033890 [Phytophthora megakarya]|uniref:Uncharacterized protein n=1 Tax=Phytophthora megakarya TaxID=4795 RepID=A0A225US99_9STRA|nr:hypothetical protein PHMEG_00033890 [Phytophthora megakarya]
MSRSGGGSQMTVSRRKRKKVPTRDESREVKAILPVEGSRIARLRKVVKLGIENFTRVDYQLNIRTPLATMTWLYLNCTVQLGISRALAMLSVVFPYETGVLCYLQPGHSHNIADRAVVWCREPVRKSNVYTPAKLVDEVNTRKAAASPDDEAVMFSMVQQDNLSNIRHSMLVDLFGDAVKSVLGDVN